MRVYLAGPMRGIPEFNFPAFMKAAYKLRTAGHSVFNPAERDNAAHGTDISLGNETGDEKLAEREHGFNLREALYDDTKYICLHAEVIACLPGWENSTGATAERALGRALGLEIWQLNKNLEVMK